MSHFTVLVVGENPEGQLEPFYEQVEKDSPYAVFHDMEDEWLEDYESDTVEVVRTLDGRILTAYNRGVYNLNPAETARWKPNPRMPFTKVYPTFEEFMAGWHDEDERDPEHGRYGYWHNPRSKWDWYEIGGRWRGYFKLKEGTRGELGNAGVFDNEPKYDVDQVRKGDVDLEGMEAEAARRANATYDEYEKATKGLTPPPEPWDDFRKTFDEIDDARNAWHKIPWVKALNKNRLDPFMECTHEYYCVNRGGRNAFVERAKNNIIMPFALLMDGKWYERGEMCWFAFVANEKPITQWDEEFHRLFESLPDDTLLTLVDCHI